MNNHKSYICIAIGIILVFFGFSIKEPGGVLTTLESLNGKSTNNYVFDKEYSAIDEYVGGDAYNYIIGATLVSGRIAGKIISKAIYIVGGIICICIGLISFKTIDPVIASVHKNSITPNLAMANHHEDSDSKQNP